MSDSLNALLDSTLDDLSDMPANLVFPDGAHMVTFEIEPVEINGKKAVRVNMTAISTEELVNAEDTPLNPGDESSVLYMLENEFGQGAFKNLLKPLGVALGTGNIGSIIEQSKGATALVVTKQRWNKDKTQVYGSIVNLTLV